MKKSLLAINPKVGAGGIGGAVSILLVGLLKRWGVDLSPDEIAALTTILVFVTGYSVSDK